MHPVIEKTFGGLSKAYYFRQLFFSIMLSALLGYLLMHGKAPTPMGVVIWLAINAFLYPYSRYVYESIVGFIIGDNRFWGNALVFMTVKMTTMILCFIFAVFVAPIGLAFLYFYHSRQEKLI